MNPWIKWLADHHETLVTLLRDPLRQVKTDADTFLLALRKAAEGDTASLNHALTAWGRLAGTTETSCLPLLFTLQQQITGQIIQTHPTDASSLLVESQRVFHAATTVLAQQESQSRLAQFQEALEKAHHAIQKLNKHKSDFISVVAHELKTPLTLIEGYNNMLQATYSQEEHPRAHMMFNGIAGGTRRLREIVEDMIDVSLLDMGLMDMNLQPVWIKRVLEIIITELRQDAAERQITLELDDAAMPDLAIEGDPERLFQVLQKVVENGIKYTPDGGTVRVTCAKMEDTVEIVVQDQGVGIDAKYLRLIFEKFFSLGQVSLHSTSKIKFKGGGPGLGLALAQGIVQAHGGKIWAESPGYNEETFPGSRFIIHLPLREARMFDDTPMMGMHPSLAYPIDEE